MHVILSSALETLTVRHILLSIGPWAVCRCLEVSAAAFLSLKELQAPHLPPLPTRHTQGPISCSPGGAAAAAEEEGEEGVKQLGCFCYYSWDSNVTLDQLRVCVDTHFLLSSTLSVCLSVCQVTWSRKRYRRTLLSMFAPMVCTR